jgi:hypothetical protein
MYAHIAQIITLAIVIAAVSAELNAVLQAFNYMRKQRPMPLSFYWKVLVIRWQWASPLFHEVYRKRIGQDPAYRVSKALKVYALAQATFLLAHVLGDQMISLRLTFDASVVVAASYFVAAYGKSFYHQRAAVMAQVKVNA